MATLRLLLEGRPGIGKTTVARRLASRLHDKGVRVTGFVTEELREGGRRVGFSVQTLDGVSAVLAHVDLPGPPRVAKYGVDLVAFERLALPALARHPESEVMLIDELGKMELASVAFEEAVVELLERSVSLVATVHVARHPFTDALKRRSGIEIERVTEHNRHELPARLAARLSVRA